MIILSTFTRYHHRHCLAGLYESLFDLANLPSKDYLTRVLACHLDYSIESWPNKSRDLLAFWLTNGSLGLLAEALPQYQTCANHWSLYTGLRKFLISHLRVLMRQHEKGFEGWGIEMLSSQIVTDDEVAFEALSVLEEACAHDAYLLATVRAVPSFKNVGDDADILLNRYSIRRLPSPSPSFRYPNLYLFISMLFPSSQCPRPCPMPNVPSPYWSCIGSCQFPMVWSLPVAWDGLNSKCSCGKSQEPHNMWRNSRILLFLLLTMVQSRLDLRLAMLTQTSTSCKYPSHHLEPIIRPKPVFIIVFAKLRVFAGVCTICLGLLMFLCYMRMADMCN